MAGTCSICGNAYTGVACMPCAREKVWQESNLKQRVMQKILSPRIQKDLHDFPSSVRKDTAAKYVQAMLNEDGQGLYIYNKSPRSGKTMLAAEIVLEWRHMKYLKADQPKVEFITLAEVLKRQEIYTTKLYNSKYHADIVHTIPPLTYYSEVPLLVLDDFGIEQIPKNRLYEDVYYLINYRYEQLLPIIFTSNCSIADLVRQFNDTRIPSRIGRMCAVVFEYHYKKGCIENTND